MHCSNDMLHVIYPLSITYQLIMKLWEGWVLTKYSRNFDLAVHTLDQRRGLVLVHGFATRDQW